MEEQIWKELYEEMKAEQDVYRAELLAMPPEEILGCTWEYTAREDILMAAESGALLPFGRRSERVPGYGHP